MAQVSTTQNNQRLVREFHEFIACDFHEQLMIWNCGEDMTEEEKQEIQSAQAFNVLASYLYGAKFPSQRV
jgi:hypothetical protein